MIEETGGIRASGKTIEVFVSFEYHWKSFYRSFFIELNDVMDVAPNIVIRDLIRERLVDELGFWSDFNKGEMTKIYYLAMIDDFELYATGLLIVGGGADLVPFFIDVNKVNELYQKMYDSEDVLFLVKSSRLE